MMIGPRAWENLFLSVDFSTKDLTIRHDGVRYTYIITPGDWELFETHERFKAWAMADVQDNSGGYANKKEKVNA